MRRASEFAEHEYINRRAMRMRAGVGATVDQLPVSAFQSGQPPLVVFGGNPGSSYQLVPEFPGAYFYVGQLPKPGPGQPLVPPHLTADMYATVASVAPASLSPLAAAMRQYYVAYQRTGGAAYATGLATSDPNRPASSSPLTKLTNLFTGKGGSSLLDSAKSLVGLGPAQATLPRPVTATASKGGLLDVMLSPVGLVLEIGALGLLGYSLSKGKKKAGRRR